MLEIGTTLREARERRHLTQAEVEAATMIPARYVDALEHERYERLPDGLYRRSFLREYAEYLGLNGDLYVVEYDLEHAPPPAPQAPPPRSRSYRDVTGAVPPRALAVGLAVVLVGVGLWWLGGRGGGSSARIPPPTPVAVAPRKAPVVTTTPTVTTAPAAPAVLRLVATTGDCWLSVRVGAAGGPVAFEGLLRQGGSMSFGLQRRLLIRMGAPQHLTATVAGREVTASLPRQTADVVVTRAGLTAG